MIIKNLENDLQVPLEGLISDCDDILAKAMGTWRNNTILMYLFSHPRRYVFSLEVLIFHEYP